jgi:hypothetical protein
MLEIVGGAVPDCVARLNARVGDLWRSAKHLPAQYSGMRRRFSACVAGKIRS